MKNFIALFVFISLFIGVSAQDDEFKVPKKYQIKTEEDCTKYKEDFIKCMNWMMDTPYNTQTSKRKSANSFFIAWLSVTETFSVEMNTDVVKYGGNGDLLFIFMAGWAKDVLETGDYHNDMLRGTMAGINAMIDFYEKNKETIGKNKDIEKYIKLKEKGELEKYIEKKLK